jgi:hypothetical protein
MTHSSSDVAGVSPITGGCQCGAVRYAMHVARVEKPHVCHCRMCQRATGGLFAALAGCAKDRLEWVKGTPAVFASSNLASRGYCRDCGTPLTFSYNQPEARIYVTIGSLDDHEHAAIEKQFGVESKLSGCGSAKMFRRSAQTRRPRRKPSSPA